MARYSVVQASLAALLGGAVFAGCILEYPTIADPDDDGDGLSDGHDATSGDDGSGVTPGTPAEAVCGDAALGGQEECDGADFGARSCADYGFDAGELTCSAQCVVDAASCYLLDGDADGLPLDEELALGTDPEAADTDLDGFDDGAEVSAGTDPLSFASWPQGTGSWPDRMAAALADGVTGGGSLSTGNVAPNLQLTDQSGQPVQLHQFYGYAIVISLGAVWCGPCQEAASSSQALWDEHREDGVIFIELLLEGPYQGSSPSQGDLANWASSFGLGYPVTSGSPQTSISSFPTFVFIGRDMVVASREAGYPGDYGITARLDQLK